MIPTIQNAWRCILNWGKWRRARDLDKAAHLCWIHGEIEAFYLLQNASLEAWQDIHGEGGGA